jgi:hypothetical protein
MPTSDARRVKLFRSDIVEPLIPDPVSVNPISRRGNSASMELEKQ